MPSSEVAPLRIYCVCGQKMKVSEDMYGRPGKCVACRLKIRIPRPDELPPNTEILYLKDHPEFLRKVKVRSSSESARDAEKEEVEVAPLPDIDPKGKVRKALGPLDVLEPLRLLSSLHAKADAQIDALQLVKDGKRLDIAAKVDPKAAELMGIETRIRAAIQDLEEELRQRLMETAIELAATNEKIAEMNLAVRVGEMPYSEYRTHIDRLRRRRDNHERRQSNLRGWLTVDDVHRAGGMMDVTFEHMPKGNFRVTFANEFDDNTTLLDAHIEGLRQALTRRALSERKVVEAKQLRKSPTESSSLKSIVNDAKAELERAQAQVQHARERLEQLADDCTNDVQAVEAQLDHTRGRLQVGQIKREEFAAAEGELLQAKTDVSKARSLIVRALNANTAAEVPRARGTFVARLAHGKPGLRAPVDAWLAWAGAGLVLVAILVPIAGGQTALQLLRMDAASGMSHWLVSFPIAIAIAASIAALIPSGVLRGAAYGAVAVLAALLSALYLHESRYGVGATFETLRAGGAFLLRPGILIYSIGLLGIGAAAALALIPTREGRVLLPIGAIGAILGLGAIVTDFGGTRLPQPSLSIATRINDNIDPPVNEATLTVANDGGRALILAANSTMANAYELLVEKRIGQNSGLDVSAPVSVQLGSAPVSLSGGALPALYISPGQVATLVYQLPEGDYRAQLVGRQSTEQVAFTLDELAPSPSAPAPVAIPAQPEPVAVTPQPQQPSLLMEALSAEVTLRGIVAAGNRAAQFGITVTLPDGATSERQYAIGDEVFTRWTIKEFNPNEQTVTLGRGSRIVILRRGEPQRLDPGTS